MLTSFEIRNFRAFKHLKIPRLGRVNLIVGKNNVGKTCLLEALRLYDARGSKRVIESILMERNEVRGDRELGRPVLMLDMLFHKHHNTPPNQELQLGPVDWPRDDRSMLVIADYALRHEHERLGREHAPFVGAIEITSNENLTPLRATELCVKTDVAASSIVDFPFLPASPVSEDVLAHWWDSVVLTEFKNRVIVTLRFIEHDLEDIAFIKHPLDSSRRVAMARKAGFPNAVPLQSLGDGVSRLFAIATAIAYRGARQESGEAGYLLTVDEVGSGIHHSMHGLVWKAIFALAEENDIQIVATTHSWDCLKGFSEALQDKSLDDGLAIRLEQVEGHEQTGAVTIDREKLPIVVRNSIEVR